MERLLFAVLALVLLQYLLDAVKLEEKARGLIWVVAVILAIAYAFFGFTFLR